MDSADRLPGLLKPTFPGCRLTFKDDSMDMRSATRSTLILLALLGLSIPVFARPVAAQTSVVISEGSIDFNRHGANGPVGDASFNLGGNIVTGLFYNFAITPDCGHFGALCTRGASVQLPTLHVTEDGFNVGSVIANGQTINQVFYAGEFHFTSPSITLPRMASVSGVVVIRAPFSVTGNLLGCQSAMTSGPCPAADTIFNNTFTGSGTVTYRLKSNKRLDFFQANSLYTYDLADVTLQFSGQ
jgi:hypothetical protein